MTYKVALVSLGCPKNQIDAEILLGFLEDGGFTVTANEDDADVIIINTCGFIEDAKQESIDAILDCATHKENGSLKLLVVTGCLAERYRDEITKEMPEVDVCVGLGSNKDIAKIILDALDGKRQNCYGEKKDLPLSARRVLSGTPYSACLKIAEGCNNRCAFCAIPAIRGPYRSRTLEDVVREASALADSGVTELTLVAQDTTCWGIDIYKKPSLSLLLRELCKIEKLHWIRVLYTYPDKIDDELLHTIAEEPKIVKYVDVPVQHCSKNVLRAMHRPQDKDELVALFDKMRQIVPNITIRTTLMAGFFGETEEDFCELCDFVKQVKFDRMGCFAFSLEEGTPAEKLDPTPDRQTAVTRADHIMRLQADISAELCAKKAGTVQEVLVEGYDTYIKMYYGRTAADALDIDGKVFFTSGSPVNPGEYINVKITDCLEYDLLGEKI